MNGPPNMVGSAPGVESASAPGAAMDFHPCPTCGHNHWPPLPQAECMCGHLQLVHDNNSGRRKKAPCTVWNPTRCPCEDFTE